MKRIIFLFILASGLLNCSTSASAQNYYAANNNYNYTAHHETPRSYIQYDGDRYRDNEYQEQINHDRDQLNRLSAHIQSDKFKMLNEVNRGDYRGAQHEAFDISHDQKERQALLNHLYYDGNNWQADHSSMNGYSDRTQREAFSRDINHDENELVEALVRNDFYTAQSIADHINRDTHHEQYEQHREYQENQGRNRHDWRN